MNKCGRTRKHKTWIHNKYNFVMNKNIVFIVISACVLSSCVSTGFLLRNEENKSYDIYEWVPVFLFDSTRTVHMVFGLSSDEDIQKYSSSRSRLKYSFSISRPLPIVKLNFFSFTNEKGDTIPCILYYKTVINDKVLVNIIDSLPIIFTDSIMKERKMAIGFNIFAECSQSYASIKTVYINYDIEVGGERFIKQCKYEKKRYWDWRPEFLNDLWHNTKRSKIKSQPRDKYIFTQ